MVRAHRYRWYASGWLWFHGFSVFHLLQLQVMPYEDFFHRSSNLPVFFRSFSSSVSKLHVLWFIYPPSLVSKLRILHFEALIPLSRSSMSSVSKHRIPYFNFFFYNHRFKFPSSAVPELHFHRFGASYPLFPAEGIYVGETQQLGHN